MTTSPAPATRLRRACLPLLLALASGAQAANDGEGRSWLAGDHHVHSEWRVVWDTC